MPVFRVCHYRNSVAFIEGHGCVRPRTVEDDGDVPDVVRVPFDLFARDYACEASDFGLSLQRIWHARTSLRLILIVRH